MQNSIPARRKQQGGAQLRGVHAEARQGQAETTTARKKRVEQEWLDAEEDAE
jgi:hypothetical protein